jgi:hypothetical protein
MILEIHEYIPIDYINKDKGWVVQNRNTFCRILILFRLVGIEMELFKIWEIGWDVWTLEKLNFESPALTLGLQEGSLVFSAAYVPKKRNQKFKKVLKSNPFLRVFST